MNATRAQDLGQTMLGFYDCITDPDKIGDLFDIIGQWFEAPDATLYVPIFESHSEKAWSLLTQFVSLESAAVPSTHLIDSDLFPTRAALEKALSEELSTEDRARLNRWHQTAHIAHPSDPLLVRLSAPQASGPHVALITKAVEGGFRLQRTARRFETEISACIAQNFDLTHAETMLLRALISGGTLVDVAARLGKSLETVRSQIKTLSGKLDVSSQTDVLRVVAQTAAHLTTADALHASERATAARASQRVRFIARPDGRRIAYEIDGAENTRTILYVHGSSEGRHLSEAVIQHVTERNWCLIRISRAGSGASTLNPKTGAALLEDHVRDCLAVLDAEAKPFVSLFSKEDGMAVAYCFASQYPERARDVIALEPVPPLTKAKDLRGFQGVAKTLGLLALYSPKLLRTSVGFAMRSLEKRVAANAAYNPVTRVDYITAGDRAGLTAELKNDTDLVAHKGAMIWHDYSFAVIDWTQGGAGANSRPNCTILYCEDSPFAHASAFDALSSRLGAPVHAVPSALPAMQGPMEKAVHLLQTKPGPSQHL